jgi:phenylpropionate dioxygenase-like ring-hydroxylating dioxygenase large terminal subunit
VPTARYFDRDFYRMKTELLWARVWQVACQLEEIPKPGDFAEYEILNQSVLVVRTEDTDVRAFDNVCRHWGVRFTQGRGSKPGGLVRPFHGYGPVAEIEI